MTRDQLGLPFAPATPELAQIVGGDVPTLGQVARINRGHATRVHPAAPSKIVCVGLNFRRHAEEMRKPLPEQPVLFTKPTTAIRAHLDPIELPAMSAEVHYEGELALVVGKRATRVAPGEALNHVLGYTILNDVTARDLQRADARYTRAKGFDSFAPFGPAIVTDVNPADLRITTRVNGVVRQDSGCDDFIFSVADLLVWITSIMTLLPGDVVSLGTPAGVGPLAVGDRVDVTVEPIGTLSNDVTTAAQNTVAY